MGFNVGVITLNFHTIHTLGNGFWQPRARPFSRYKSSRTRLLQTTNHLITWPLNYHKWLKKLVIVNSYWKDDANWIVLYKLPHIKHYNPQPKNKLSSARVFHNLNLEFLIYEFSRLKHFHISPSYIFQCLKVKNIYLGSLVIIWKEIQDSTKTVKLFFYSSTSDFSLAWYQRDMWFTNCIIIKDVKKIINCWYIRWVTYRVYKIPLHLQAQLIFLSS